MIATALLGGYEMKTSSNYALGLPAFLLLRSRSEHPPRFLVGQHTPGRSERVDKARQLLAQA
jgi:hypothetical protein